MNFFKKWYTYQKERFPVLTYGLYVFCIVFATFCYTNYCGRIQYERKYLTLIPMFIVAFLQFLMVRIVDEFKDYEEDCKYRPYRPVPRGLITLKELKILFIICVLLQLIITYFISWNSVIFLILMWIFFAVMSKGFFIKQFLDKHILVGVALDELILPIAVIYISTFVCNIELKCLIPLLIMSYIISWIIEIARKIRCKEDEENGVKTYTAVFGISKAIVLLEILETFLTIICMYIIGIKIYIAILFDIILVTNILFVIKKNRKLSKCVEYFADLYVMILYISLVGLII